MRQTALLLMFALLVVDQSTAVPTWDQLESVLERNDNNTATDSITDAASHELIMNAIQTATERIRRNLAEELDELLEKLPQIIQATPAPVAAVPVAAPAVVPVPAEAPAAPVAPASPAPATSQGRTAEVQLGQQLVWAAAGEQPLNSAPPKPRPRPLPPPKAAAVAADPP